MTDDELLALLGERERAERTRAAAWESVARGTATADAVTALSAEDGAAMASAAAPFGPDAEDRILARIAEARSGRSGDAVPKIAPVVDLAAARSKRLRRIATIVGPLAAAAAAVFALRMGSPPQEGDAIPAYAFSVSGGSAGVRGEHADRDRIVIHGSADETFEIVARPATASPQRPAAQGFVWKSGAPARSLAAAGASLEVAESGAIRIRGSAAALGDATELRVVVSDAALAIDAAEAMVSSDVPSPRSGARVLRVSITRE